MIRPYPLASNNAGLYIFTTYKAVTYVCRFRFNTPALSPILGIYDLEIYDFEFYPVNISEGKGKTDDRISATIIHLFDQFFTNNLRVFIYLCDAVDGRHMARHQLFKNWHAKYLAKQLIRIPIEIEMETDIIYGCVMVRSDFPHMDILESELIRKARDIILAKFD